MPSQLRHLVLILGDQLDEDASALSDFDPQQDAIWMAEVTEESTHITSAKQRTTVFLSAMRHFAARLEARGWTVLYTPLDAPDNSGTLAGELDKAILRTQPQKLVMTAPGEWRVLQSLRSVACTHALSLEIRDDTHFFSTVRDFAEHARGRKQLRLEFFYREMRQKTGILMDGKKPVGDQWNFDADNRGSFGKQGPGLLPQPSRFEPDAITQDVIQLVNQRFAHHPGSVASFGWPVTREQALSALADFIAHRLPSFGLYQDAMWEGDVWLYHSHLSCALNLKLLNPREVVAAAEDALRRGHAPLEAVEGFVRQILGWREYVRGIYWTHMPDYLERNAMQAHEPLPEFYWTGETEMACLRDAIQQTLAHGYAHHIQRLMVTGLYALLLGVEPKAVHQWYLGVYVDAVEWVELPNTLGMSQFADGGLMASKPYVASGKYIDRMSNHCKGCRFNPAQSTGETACPFTTLYWDYLIRHADTLAKNPRMLMQLKNANRLTSEEREAIALQAQSHRHIGHPVA
ncbi:cryptochrome/photolyase family protein [Limnohabitans sp. TS-CS-82]|uniref:cryptochrome/photolyase family protein n=1 Tax=Limnohabitans sp. TS-CS-82 TaxID=2094193 RepID=UPI000CF29544|nr:cryptochrome/photolyase family protein [Limnohabitans sp. TS-CS-82]PQA79773.1 cryptochrome/photolyase family protein [Limnohabitans sp. TS-CS-82]